MKSKFLLFIIVICVLLQCKEKAIGQDIKNKIVEEDDNSNINDQIKIKKNSVIIPNLKLVVNLSNDAIQKLKENKETVIASLLLYGSIEDEDSLPDDIRPEVGPDGLRLGVFQVEEKEISGTINFSFDNLIIPKKLYDKLTDKDISVNINVFSGRKHFDDNILNMEAFDSKLSNIISKGNRIKLNGHLLPEILKPSDK
nr:hypothetical protein [Elizabethkingia sp. ASV34]